MASVFDDLNPAQRDAVSATQGPVLVLAGAGSGKTRVLTHRIAHLVLDQGVPADRILAITFTNKAAGEMRMRLETLLGPRAAGMWVATFHAMCARILRRDGERLGFTRSFTIYDDDDSKRLMKQVLQAEGLDQQRFPPTLLTSRISSAKNELESPSAFEESHTDPVGAKVARVYRAYQRALLEANAMDFDDLLVNTYRLLDGHEDVLAHYQDRFTYVHVDEYQDTNHAQYRIVALLAGANRNVMVVGDDDQSIYGWRGADVRNILEFEEDFPDARVIKLEQNYRSTQKILEVANYVVAHNEGRKPKTLWTANAEGEAITRYHASDERDESQFVVAEVERLLREEHRSYSDFAVFYRTNAQSRVVENVFLRAGTPYQIVGSVKFFQRAEVKDALAYLRAIVNPADGVSLARIVNVPRRGIGKTTMTRVAEYARAHGLTLCEALEDAAGGEWLGTGPTKRIAAFVALMEDLRETDAPTLKEQVESIVAGTGLVRALEAEDTLEARGRVENVMELVGQVEEFERDHAEATLEDFMEWASLRTDLDSLEAGERAVTLMTLHNAKGLEFPVVFVTGMEDSIFPHANVIDPAGLEEERRLCYVGITRARERLYLLHAAKRSLFGRPQFNAPSRFFREMPEEHLESKGTGSTAPLSRGYSRERGGAWEESFAAPRDDEGGRVFGSGEPRHAEQGAAGATAEDFGPGDRVRHKSFGEGAVVVVEGDKLAVDFDEVGLKTLLIGYAPIEKVV
jgi:DNA helicase-2/ATP-dependent DNA helicase PcrA